jgi:predicted RNase H-like nuclease (RuvC/YqgF family)
MSEEQRQRIMQLSEIIDRYERVEIPSLGEKIERSIARFIKSEAELEAARARAEKAEYELMLRRAELEDAARREGQLAITLAEARARITELETQLAAACHVKADDKVGFDWAVLGRIAELEAECNMRAGKMADLIIEIMGRAAENVDAEEDANKLAGALQRAKRWIEIGRYENIDEPDLSAELAAHEARKAGKP